MGRTLFFPFLGVARNVWGMRRWVLCPAGGVGDGDGDGIGYSRHTPGEFSSGERVPGREAFKGEGLWWPCPFWGLLACNVWKLVLSSNAANKDAGVPSVSSRSWFALISFLNSEKNGVDGGETLVFIDSVEIDPTATIEIRN